MTAPDKEKWIQDFALAAMASYAALNYDENCFNGWRKNEKFLDYEDAEVLATQAYERTFEKK